MSILRLRFVEAQGQTVARKKSFCLGNTRGFAAVECLFNQAVQTVGGGEY